jgi:hypothetical protein
MCQPTVTENERPEHRLLHELVNLDPDEERALAEEWLAGESAWAER